MNDLARERLGELMSSYGVGLCNTPRMCEILIRQKCPEFPDEVEVLAQAVHCGAVQRLIKMPRAQDWDGFSGGLVGEMVQSGIQEERARWAVDSWALALGKHPSAAPAPAPPPVNWDNITDPSHPGAGGMERGAFYHPMLGAVWGGMGAAIGSVALLIMLFAILSGIADMLPEQMGGSQGQALVIILVIFAILNFFIAAVFGAIGGGFGLFVAHHLTGETRGSLFWAKGGAFMGAMLGAAIGMRFCWPVGLIIGSLLGGWLGAFSSARASLTKRW
jgi:hypothetical protein